MQASILRKIFLAFLEVHILHHARKEPIYASWMIGELKRHGYDISAGTLYPIFHSLEKAGLLMSEARNVNGKIRKYYTLTAQGDAVLAEAKAKIGELAHEL